MSSVGDGLDVRVDVLGPRGTGSLTVAVDKRLGFAYTMTSGDSSALGGEARKDTLLLRLTDGADLTATLGKVAALARGAHATVGRSAPQRERVQQIMKIITALVAGLLAISVLIALVGVGNTLALSVHERRRESALLRALGVTRGQVKGCSPWKGCCWPVSAPSSASPSGSPMDWQVPGGCRG